MAGIDELISKSLTEVIKNNLDPLIEKKVKMRLFKKYGLSINQAIKDFSKLDEILKNVLRSDASNFEQKCLAEIISIKNQKTSIIVTLKDKNLINLVLEIFGDSEYRNIIEYSFAKPLLITEIIDLCEISKTSGYRKINFLVRNGFLVQEGKELTVKRRTIEKFTTIFQKINFEMNKKNNFVKFVIPQKIFEQSSSIQIILR